MIKAILLATDFSGIADAAGLAARAYARHFGAHLHVLHVIGPGEEHVTSILEGLAARLGEPGSVLTAVEFGDVAEQIVEYARVHAIDLVVIGTHGRTGPSRVLLGSVAERVVRTAPCPVLTVPASGAAPTAAEAPATAPEAHPCLVCAGPSDDLVCEPCRARIRGEVLERKLRDERAGHS